MSNCTGKKTKYQPGLDEWKCPKCHSPDLYLEDTGCVDEDCPNLHVTDYIYCPTCGADYTGAALARLLSKTLVECPTCKGKGMMPKETIDSIRKGALEDALRVQCGLCRDGVEVYRNGLGEYRHRSLSSPTDGVPCHAFGILSLLGDGKRVLKEE